LRFLGDAMRILVDGYNLAHASGILSRNIGPGTLQRARDGLVGFLKASLREKERAGTTIVFDAQNGPRDLPTEQTIDGLRVLYSFGYPTADALIEELIRSDSAPRQLVVVSSDRQIQLAARRRRATSVDSEIWYAEMRQRRREAARAERGPPEKPSLCGAEEEIEYWMGVFDSETSATVMREERETAGECQRQPAGNGSNSKADEREFENPFPPGYGEDLLIDDEEGES
jgi:uncharacterized protein